jgi:hypothetical protein
MASPHVAGAAALVLAVNPTFTPQQVRDTLVNQAVTGAVDNPGLGSPDKLLQVAAPGPTERREVLRLRAHANNLVVDADPSGNSFLVANRIVDGAWEEFDEVDAGGGFVALRAHSNGKFVTADLNNGGKLINNRTAIGAWEMFDLHRNGNTVSLTANANGKVVTAENGGNSPLVANRTTIGAWEQFDVAVPTSVISLGSTAKLPNALPIVTAENGGNSPLIANRDDIGTWEEFDVVDLGHTGTNGFFEEFALRAHANGKFVTADLNHGGVLIANRTAVQAWEKFNIGETPDGFDRLLANANGKIVTADYNNGGTLTANRTVVGSWEEFLIIAD